MLELSPELQKKQLTAQRYILLGALAVINPEALDKSWQEIYQQRIAEIEQRLEELNSVQ